MASKKKSKTFEERPKTSKNPQKPLRRTLGGPSGTTAPQKQSPPAQERSPGTQFFHANTFKKSTFDQFWPPKRTKKPLKNVPKHPKSLRGPSGAPLGDPQGPQHPKKQSPPPQERSPGTPFFHPNTFKKTIQILIQFFIDFCIDFGAKIPSKM